MAWQAWVAMIAFAAFLLNLGVNVIAGIRALDKNNVKLLETFAKKIENERKEIDEKLDETDANIENLSRDVGETTAALREKVTQTELWNRDTFVTKRTMDLVISEIRESWRRFEDKIDMRFNRIDEKLEKK